MCVEDISCSERVLRRELFMDAPFPSPHLQNTSLWLYPSCLAATLSGGYQGFFIRGRGPELTLQVPTSAFIKIFLGSALQD